MPADFLHARRTYLIVIAALLVAMTSGARDKSKDNVPAYVLEAHTVSVLIDPQAGMDVRDPQANRTAQRDVETALLNWGRFQTTLNSREADLLVVVRKGNGRIANATIADPSQNRRPGAIDPTDSGVFVGAQRGSPNGYPSNTTNASDPGSGQIAQRGGPQMEVGEAEDSFVVYRGNVDNPLDAPAAWRLIQHDSLRSPGVPAVNAFRKAVEQAEKAAGHP